MTDFVSPNAKFGAAIVTKNNDKRNIFLMLNPPFCEVKRVIYDIIASVSEVDYCKLRAKWGWACWICRLLG